MIFLEVIFWATGEIEVDVGDVGDVEVVEVAAAEVEVTDTVVTPSSRSHILLLLLSRQHPVPTCM